MPRQTQLALGPLVAAVGAVLLIVSLFLDWYEGITGFTAFEFIDLLLALLAVATIASLAAGAGLFEPAPPAVSLGGALFTIFVVLTQIINDPPMVVLTERDQDIGIWLALSGAALMLAGAVLGYASISLAFEPRQRRAGADDRGRDRDVTSVPTPGATEKPDPEPGRPVASDQDPTRPLSDPAAPRRSDDPTRP